MTQNYTDSNVCGQTVFKSTMYNTLLKHYEAIAVPTRKAVPSPTVHTNVDLRDGH